MYKLLSIHLFLTGILTWGSIIVTYFFIDFNRNYASSSYPGDLTTTQEWTYLMFSSLIFCVAQIMALILAIRQMKDKRGFKAFLFISILSVIIFFCSIYLYLFGS